MKLGKRNKSTLNRPGVDYVVHDIRLVSQTISRSYSVLFGTIRIRGGQTSGRLQVSLSWNVTFLIFTSIRKTPFVDDAAKNQFVISNLRLLTIRNVPKLPHVHPSSIQVTSVTALLSPIITRQQILSTQHHVF